MSGFELDAQQCEAVDASFDGCVAILGPSGTGKSQALASRMQRARALFPQADPLVSSAPRAAVELAWRVLRSDGCDATEIDDVTALSLFSKAALPFLAMEWQEVVDDQLDLEVPGLRSPARFLESAFRLIGKLRTALISPQEFLARSLAGATNFYAKPPNFAHPELIRATKEAYRNSLDVTEVELQRQYRREIDLAKILAKLYSTYVEVIIERGLLTPRDAVALAIERLDARPELARSLRARIGYAGIDDAQELAAGAITLLQRVFGDALTGVTLAGDGPSTLGAFHGARAEAAFAIAGNRVLLQRQYRSPLGIELACRQLTASMEKPDLRGVEPCITVHRAKNPDREMSFIADSIAELLRDGVTPSQIGVLFRSVADVHGYETALLERGVPVQVGGDVNVFADRRALDGLALLWNVWDPFRHDWLLRTLSAPALALSDATIAALCSEPANAQTALFILDDEAAPTVRASRWDPKRDVRLGWNVIRGDADATLGKVARERVESFRERRIVWLEALASLPFEQFVQQVWNQGLARSGAPSSAQALGQELALSRLLDRLSSFARAMPEANLGDILAYAQSRAEGREVCEIAIDDRFVQILSIDAARGREFQHVFLADVRAGSFPRWYVPDAFLFSPKLGMIPKENVGDARSARTAKFTYYMHRARTREQYNEQERRAFVYALRRATHTATVTTSGRATRGLTAPEFLEEMRVTRLPGTRIID